MSTRELDTCLSTILTCLCRWTKAEFHYLTDALLGLIQDSPQWRQALGFHVDGTVPSGGKKLVDIYAEIARRLLLTDESLSFTEDDIPALVQVIKNRINTYVELVSPPLPVADLIPCPSSVKKTYTKWHNKLKDTGSGLVEADREAEITPGSELASIWGTSFLLLS